MLDKKAAEQAMLQKLAASGLTKKDLPYLQFKPYTADEVTSKLNGVLTAPPAAGFSIPYHTPTREPTNFFRFRYLEQPHRNGFAGLAEQKELRYVQPPNMPPRLYFSMLYPDWDGLFKKKEKSVYVTEGELKADCACKFGFPCLGLGGVWNFKSKTELLIPDLQRLAWKDAQVYIVYDSDAANNINVLMAENALARQLLALGAHPFIIRLPALKGLKKTGLDDFLLAKGKFLELTERAEEWAQSRALHELNDEVVFLRRGVNVLELRSRDLWTVADFKNAAYANRSFLDTRGEKPKMMRTAQAWIEWEGRSELEAMTYAPGEPTVVRGEFGYNFNLWNGWGMRPEEIQKGSIAPWKQLLDYIFTGAEPAHRRWFEQWLAYPLQHPGAKLFQAVLVWGPPGVGKTLIAHTMRRIYGENFSEVTDQELTGPFNAWAKGKQFALGDEITGGDKRGVAELLKGLVTGQTLRINPKHIQQYEIPNCINWYFTSNHCDAFFVERGDRRYFIQQVVADEPLPSTFYAEYDKWYKSAAVGALFYYLLHLDLSDFNPYGHAPFTHAKEEMIADSRSDVASWCAELREHPDNILKTRVIDGSAHNVDQPNPRRLWTTTELYKLYDPGGNSRVTLNGLSRELKRAGFHKAHNGAPIMTDLGIQKLWIVRDIAKLKEVRQPIKFATIYEREKMEEAKLPKYASHD